jgi:CBS domain-containing protein
MRNKQRTPQISDVMTPDVVSVQLHDTLADAARAMREHDIGDVIVLNGEQLFGIVTDRDIVVRGIAEGFQPDVTEVKDIASKYIRSISPEDYVDDAMQVMKDNAIRRLPVVAENGKVIGVVSLGDVVIHEESGIPVADISAAPPNR